MINLESRQSFLGSHINNVFEEQHIGIVGLCGGGSHISQQLTHIGFLNFSLCDFDHVEHSNLPRMVGSRPFDAKILRSKLHVTSRMMRQINPRINIECIESKWQDNAEKLRKCTVIFGCVDSLSARYELEIFCRRYLIPYIDIGMDVHSTNHGYAISGQIALSLPDSLCLRCLGVIKESELVKEHARYGAAGGRPQVIWPNGILASTAVGQYMNMILPWSTEPTQAILMEYDGNRHSVRESSKLHHLKNHVCQHFSAFSLGDPFFSISKLLNKTKINSPLVAEHES